MNKVFFGTFDENRNIVQAPPENAKFVVIDVPSYKRIKRIEEGNTRLLNIVKERANADRNLRPKKIHSGYVLQSMERSTMIYYFDTGGKRKERTVYRCWRCKMQTPFPMELPYEDVEKLFEQDFEHFGAATGIDRELEELAYLNDYVSYAENGDFNFMFERHFMLNVSQGYWSLDFKVRKPLKISPEILPTNSGKVKESQ